MEKLSLRDIPALWAESERARVPVIMYFGKHKGTPIKNLPTDYMRWLLKQPNTDPYLVQAIEEKLNGPKLEF
jgi:exodeoxyribonuclease X